MTTPSQAEALKPCPFCGGKAVITHREFPPIGTRYNVHCENSDCDCFIDMRKASEAEAAAQWNRRASLASADTRVDLFDPKTHAFVESDEPGFCDECNHTENAHNPAPTPRDLKGVE